MYKFIVCGRNHEAWIQRCLESIRSQEHRGYDVCVVDDASTDSAPQIIRDFCDTEGWRYIMNVTPYGAMHNQVRGIEFLEPADGDVIVWVDGDDRLAHPHVLDILDQYYGRGALVTYGSYLPDPPSPTCNPASPYPTEVIQTNSYRAYRYMLFNHLRTVSWYIFRQLEDADFHNAAGEWFQSCCDAAVMIPSMELARGRTAFIHETLYYYNSENPQSDWRRHPRQVDADHGHILHTLQKKV